ncbi:hypothetical protein Swit_0480 [Rhizorhabdus wittichii RW1]|uniref:Uncharacterized protein n=1 Tax=Rhizorhabdus wittichii (strain DSM 6014 / CCUG 31198 / JCM 15750 / NBRC 105917 / EY 4224 / RW1) TaxID=392499 RepID=A0A9J9H8G4_RHIWR|nr:hypothetical protein Swit_0480 [Rhizorhabdus wittichii RW1]
MSFQPFGYKFEIHSPVSSTLLKTRLRARKKGWFHRQAGARGWIVGPFVCLWFRASDRYGPLLVGVLSDDGSGCRIRGRAGSDLNGMAAFVLMLPFLIGLTGLGMAHQEPGAGRFAFIAVIVVLVSPFMLWVAHSNRKDAEPLVRFLRDVADERAGPGRSRPDRVSLSGNLGLFISGEPAPHPLNSDMLYDALLRTGTDEFIVLERSEHDYLQIASRAGEFRIEMRDGSHLRHYLARRVGKTTAKRRTANFDFEFEEALGAAFGYATGGDLPKIIAWEKMDMPPPSG